MFPATHLTTKNYWAFGEMSGRHWPHCPYAYMCEAGIKSTCPPESRQADQGGWKESPVQNPEARTNPAPFRCMLLPHISQLACALVPSRESQMTHCMDASKIAADRPAEVLDGYRANPGKAGQPGRASDRLCWCHFSSWRGRTWELCSPSQTDELSKITSGSSLSTTGHALRLHRSQWNHCMPVTPSADSRRVKAFGTISSTSFNSTQQDELRCR